jgi:5-methyltetrahydropteroyltriglutamate--homocysteine methyltransferase
MKVRASDRKARSVARAEGVGSLLRPRAVTDGVETIYGGMTTALRSQALAQKPRQLHELNEVVDGEIPRLVQRQIDAGLDVVTDGELRRVSFLNSFYDAVTGLGPAAARYELSDGLGGIVHALADPVILSRLSKSASPLAVEAAFMHGTTDFPFKVTIPAPSYFYTAFIATPDKGYRSRHELVEDVIAIERALVAEAIAAGANWIQFDFPVYPALVDEAYTAGMLKELGLASREALLARAIAADRAVTEGIPSEATVALHLCRGNIEGGFWNGSLAPIAEQMFSELPHDRFLFEWEDTQREGDYEPIKYVPKGRIMAMGLVSTKKTRVETVDEIVARLETAARYLDMSQLAICPQCGFASLCTDHLVQAEEVQWRKLEVIGKVADRLWPRE